MAYRSVSDFSESFDHFHSAEGLRLSKRDQRSGVGGSSPISGSVVAIANKGWKGSEHFRYSFEVVMPDW